ncbi:MAG: CBS domain-containing protein, partial [Thermomicrobiaceae bacterium]|nr:CBS domain-containing protein [Thermomicrobiaceae bacterium]
VEKATRIASMLGVGIGYLFIIGGIFLAFRTPISGIWLIAIGWFLQSAAEQSYQQLRLTRTFRGARVGGLMDPHPVVVRPDTTIDDLIDHYILGRNVRGAPVVEDGHLVGIITLNDIKEAPRAQWPTLTVRDLMTPRDRLVVATPQTDLQSALEAMSSRDIHQIPVVDHGELVGLLTRGAVIRFLQLREELPQIGEREAERAATQPGRRPEHAG